MEDNTYPHIGQSYFWNFCIAKVVEYTKKQILLFGIAEELYILLTTAVTGCGKSINMALVAVGVNNM